MSNNSKKNRNKGKFRKYKSQYKFRRPTRRYYVKNFNKKRPFKPKKKITECTCYNCEKLGHLAKDCKLPKNPKKKQIAEIVIENAEYMQLEYIDYELDSDDSIYELSENELNEELEELSVEND